MQREPAYFLNSIEVPPYSYLLGSSLLVDSSLKQFRPPLFVCPTTRYVTVGPVTPASDKTSVVVHDWPTCRSDAEPNGIGRPESRGISGLPKTERGGRSGPPAELKLGRYRQVNTSAYGGRSVSPGPFSGR